MSILVREVLYSICINSKRGYFKIRVILPAAVVIKKCAYIEVSGASLNQKQEGG
jgi:hypothetical protein